MYWVQPKTMQNIEPSNYQHCFWQNYSADLHNGHQYQWYWLWSIALLWCHWVHRQLDCLLNDLSCSMPAPNIKVPNYWYFVRRIYPLLVDSPNKGPCHDIIIITNSKSGLNFVVAIKVVGLCSFQYVLSWNRLVIETFFGDRRSAKWSSLRKKF